MSGMLVRTNWPLSCEACWRSPTSLARCHNRVLKPLMVSAHRELPSSSSHVLRPRMPVSTKSWEGHSGAELDSIGGFTVIECERCRFRHIVPVPTAEELESVYRHEYYTSAKPM